MRGKIVALCLALAACAETGPTAAQKDGDRMQQEVVEAVKESRSCYYAALNTPSWMVLQPKFWASGDLVPPPNILANHEKPTQNEVKALLYYSDSTARCRQIFLNGLARAHPLLLKAEINNMLAFDSLMLQLVRREISWGEFAKAIDQKNKAVSQEYTAASQQIRDQFLRAHNDESQQRQADAAAMNRALQGLGDALGAWGQRQQQLNNTRANYGVQPVFTSCRYVGNTLNCATF